jgi:hypothetical protein
MKTVKLLSLALALICIATPLVRAQDPCTPAGIPYDGNYSTYAGNLLAGRASEAWCGSPLMPGVPGNTENAMSWDGSSLGSQWKAWGMYIDATGAVWKAQDLDSLGTGWVDYVTNYEGGQFWLSGSHIWSDGTDLTGQINYYNVSARVSYVEGEVVGVTSNVVFNGVFDQCPNCNIEYVIANAMRVWVSGDPDPAPADYPPFLCGPGLGELFEVCCIMTNITCHPIGTEVSTWGMIKELYR